MPEISIRTSLRNIRKKIEIGEMFDVLPPVYQAVVKFSGYITRDFPDKNMESVLDKVLLKMYRTYEQHITKSDMQLLISLLYSDILDSVNDIACNYMVKGITGHGESRTWEPLSEPIVNWVRRDGITQLQWFSHDWLGVATQTAETKWLRYLMASKIFTFGEIIMLNDAGVIHG
jgi:hypothetical protein